MLEFFKNLDRRWIFLAMFLSVLIPLILQQTFPEFPTKLVQDSFDAIENMPSGSKVLVAFDYDPASEGELSPMSTAFVRHLCEKRHKIYFIALWPVGSQLIQQIVDREIKTRYPNMKYGEDYVNLG